MKQFTMGSLFDGVAMFPLAATLNGITPVWASEIEKFPMEVSKYHFPNMEHLGDVCLINGAEIKPVDIITFGSPCQDLSVAGKREGMAGERSGLFSQAIRIIREMRFVTNGEYPRYAIWENVPGAFSSNKGQDFRTVLEEITASEIPMPKSGKWANAGMVRGDGYSVAWRVCDAQYWGVAQRRKRIFLVADFRGQRAGEILFERESVSRHFAESGEAREEVAGSVGDSVETTVNLEQCSDRVTINARKSCTLKSGGGGGGAKTGLYLLPIGDGCLTPWDGQGNRIVSPGGISPALRGGGERGYPAFNILHQKPIAFNGRQDPVHGQVTGALDTDRATQCVMHPKVAGTICASGAGTNRPAGQGNKTDLCIVNSFPLVGHGVYSEGGAATLRSFYGDCGGGSKTLVKQGYAVRRLMPIECERLMSMPDGWTDITGASDTARYKAIGNSLVMNIADWIFSQIVNIGKES